MARQDIAKEFARQWAKAIVGVAAFGAGGVLFILGFWLVGLLPLYVGAYVELGQLPWQAGVMPMATAEHWPYVAAQYAWFIIGVAGFIAALKTTDSAELNGGDSAQ